MNLKYLTVAVICACFGMPTHPAQCQYATNLQEGSQFVVAPDSNGNPQIVAFKLYLDPHGSTPTYLQLWGTGLNTNATGLNLSGSGWTLQPLPKPIPLTPGTNYQLNTTYYIQAPPKTAPPPQPIVAGLSNYYLVYDEEFQEGNINNIYQFTIPTTATFPFGTEPFDAHMASGGNDLLPAWEGIWTNAPYNNLVATAGGPFTMNVFFDPNAAPSPGQPAGGNWIGGMLDSMDDKKTGFQAALAYWECKMRIPPLLASDPANTPGLFNSFWLETEPTAGSGHSAEIDVFEALSIDYTKLHCTIHDWDHGTNPDMTKATTITGSNYSAAPHVFSCLVNPDFIHWYVDGVEVFNAPTPPNAKLAMNARIDSVVGGGWPINIQKTAVYPAQIYYLRCWINPAN